NKHFSFFQDIPYKYLNYPMANCRGYFKTKNSSYWFGANDGLYVSTKNSRNFKHYFLKNKNVERPIFFFIEDLMELNSELYLITLSSGRLPVIIDKSSGKILHRLSFSNSTLNPDSPINFKLLLKDDKERIWITSDHGLYQINLRNYKIEIPKIKINEDISRLNFYHIIKDLNNNIFISAHNPTGLLMINAEGDSATLYKKYFKDNKILNITDLNINKKGELFLFSEPFSFKFDINSKRFRRIGKGEKTNVLNHEWIRCGITDKDNVLFGYEGIGMIVFQENQDSIIKISKDNNIQSNRIYEFEKDDNGNIWAATGLGLIVLRPDTYQFVMSLNQKDGLIENNLGMYWGSAFKKLLSGDMFIGGHGFFTIFNPDSVLQKDIHVFKLKLESLTINGKVKHFDKIIDKKERIILNHNENDLLFEFANLDFNKKSNQKYKYRLIGYDDKWHLTTQNQLTFNKIPPGKYKLELGLVDGSGIKSLSIDVIPSWWQTWWFKLLLVIFLLGIVYFFISKRIEYIKDKEKLKSKYERKMLETEMKMLQSQMNSHFLFNTLNSIKNYIIKNETREAANYLTTFSGLIRNILNNSSQKFISLQSELEALEQYLNLELLRFDNKFKYEILIDDTIDVATVKVPPLLLQPFVENAIWHGLLHKDKKGKITIEIKKEKNQIKYIITDNGIGRK
ncbi:MAG TPA: hypothetical protein ENK91_04990, partial [Bacteroidetes bacterium]|nr:hypothetical protein [Bacteroidota bacterium]